MRRIIAALLYIAAFGLSGGTAGESFATSQPSVSEPRFATAEEASILVRVRGQGVCTGAPIMGTKYVVTAAHCVLDKKTWELSTRYDVRVEYNDQRFDVDHVLVDLEAQPHDGAMHPEIDVAVLVLRTEIPGVGVELGVDKDALSGATLVALQTLATKDSFLRPTDYKSLKAPKGASNSGVITYEAAPAACTVSAPEIEVREAGYLQIPCGMIPGGSGGPMIVKHAGKFILVGVLSTVNFELTSNGIAPVSAVARLLASPEKFMHDFALPDPASLPATTPH
jgi:hypothetical protein